jgi:hypothetical protein
MESDSVSKARKEYKIISAWYWKLLIDSQQNKCVSGDMKIFDFRGIQAIDWYHTCCDFQICGCNYGEKCAAPKNDYRFGSHKLFTVEVITLFHTLYDGVKSNKRIYPENVHSKSASFSPYPWSIMVAVKNLIDIRDASDDEANGLTELDFLTRGICFLDEIKQYQSVAKVLEMSKENPEVIKSQNTYVFHMYYICIFDVFNCYLSLFAGNLLYSIT